MSWVSSSSFYDSVLVSPLIHVNPINLLSPPPVPDFLPPLLLPPPLSLLQRLFLKKSTAQSSHFQMRTGRGERVRTGSICCFNYPPVCHQPLLKSAMITPYTLVISMLSETFSFRASHKATNQPFQAKSPIYC